MAYFRCGGGGIPSSLKTDMNTVYNKKFGTSTTYDPSVWAETANLMGPLPERTASGSIAHITDGADTVPIKSWEVEIAPTLMGKSAIECTQAGKNLLDLSTATGTGTIWFHYDNGIELKKGVTYTFSCGNYGTGSIALYGIDHSTQVAYAYISASSAQVTYTPTENITVCPRIYQSGLTISNLVNVQLEVGSTATSYEPYTAPTVSTVNLGRTVYGGTADVVNGTGTEGYNKITLSSLLTDLNVAQIGTTGVYRIRFSIADAKGAINSAVFNGLCDYYTPLTANQTYNKNEGISINTSGQCYIYDSRFNTFTSLNDFKTWIDANPVNLCYELATGTDFAFTPITPTPETALGTNNFWADEGDSSVTYRADIDLLLGGN